MFGIVGRFVVQVFEVFGRESFGGMARVGEGAGEPDVLGVGYV